MEKWIVTMESMGFHEYILNSYDSSSILIKEHHHDFYEILIYKADGGKLKIGNNTFDIRAGDVALVDIFETHSVDVPDSSVLRYNICLGPDFILNLCTMDSNLLGIFKPLDPANLVTNVDKKTLSHLIELIEKYANIDTYVPGYDIYQKSILYELLSIIYRAFYNSKQEVEYVNTSELMMIVNLSKYISNNINKDLSLDALAEAVHFSKYYLCKKFKKLTGLTPNKYVIGKRIEKAKLLLISGVSTTNVAINTGFTNYSHFYKAFKQCTGMSPSEYKQQCMQIYEGEDAFIAIPRSISSPPLR